MTMRMSPNIRTGKGIKMTMHRHTQITMQRWALALFVISCFSLYRTKLKHKSRKY